MTFYTGEQFPQEYRLDGSPPSTAHGTAPGAPATR